MTTQLVLFDYAQLDSETRIVVQQRTTEIKDLMRRTAQDIINIGEKLIEVKNRLPHGAFGGWLEGEFQWTPQHARRFMSVADAFHGQNEQIERFASSALYLLAAPSTPDEARTEAISRAEQGERITHAEAKNIVTEHKRPKPEPYRYCQYCGKVDDTVRRRGKEHKNMCDDCYDREKPPPSLDHYKTIYCPECGAAREGSIKWGIVMGCDECGHTAEAQNWHAAARKKFEIPRPDYYCPECNHKQQVTESVAHTSVQIRCEGCKSMVTGWNWNSEPASSDTCTECGFALSPNDVRLGITLCKACERQLQTESEPTPPNGFNYKRDSRQMQNQDVYEAKGMDACQTPAYAIDPLLDHLDQFSTIWEPAAGEHHIVTALYDAGRSQDEVIASDIITGKNFFEYEPAAWRVIVTNPPFSLKFKWLERCYELGKPFALLLPVEVLGTQTAQRLFAEYGMELILMDKRVDFKMPNKGWDSSAQFPTAWFTWGLNIGTDITYATIEKTKQDA